MDVQDIEQLNQMLYNKLVETETTHHRYLYDQINWDNRLIGIKGAAGVGKTTLILQHIKETMDDLSLVMYASLDNLWFQKYDLMDLVEYHYSHNGTYLFLDEIHYLKNWATYIKNIYDNYPKLHIVYTGSSILSITKHEADLGRRQRVYMLHPMSFREFLLFEGYQPGNAVSIDAILTNHINIAMQVIPKGQHILPLFERYCQYGCYPFYKEEGDSFNERLQSTIRRVIENDLPADFTPVLGQQLAKPEDLYQKVAYTSSLATTSATAAKLNPFLVGVKLAMFYELPRQDKKMRPMPVEPKPRMAALVTNAETGKAIAGAQVTIEQQPSGKTINKATNGKGTMMTRLAKGSYRVAANKLGFFPCDTIDYRHIMDLGDTLRFNLVPEPKPIIYTLCGYVFDAETRVALNETEVRIASTADTTVTYRGTTNEDGLFVSDMLAGEYTVNAIGQGYMPLTETVQFEQDTLRFFMTRIKEGIKVKINHLYFATNKTVILPESEAAMSDLADFLRENPTVTIRITGHTDAVGSDAANMKLSIGRAKAVRADLISRGIDADRIEYDGKGKTEPIATNDTEEGRAQNRRVEFEITGTNGEDIQQIY